MRSWWALIAVLAACDGWFPPPPGAPASVPLTLLPQWSDDELRALTTSFRVSTRPANGRSCADIVAREEPDTFPSLAGRGLNARGAVHYEDGARGPRLLLLEAQIDLDPAARLAAGFQPGGLISIAEGCACVQDEEGTAADCQAIPEEGADVALTMRSSEPAEATLSLCGVEQVVGVPGRRGEAREVCAAPGVLYATRVSTPQAASPWQLVSGVDLSGVSDCAAARFEARILGRSEVVSAPLACAPSAQLAAPDRLALVADELVDLGVTAGGLLALTVREGVSEVTALTVDGGLLARRAPVALPEDVRGLAVVARDETGYVAADLKGELAAFRVDARTGEVQGHVVCEATVSEGQRVLLRASDRVALAIEGQSRLFTVTSTACTARDLGRPIQSLELLEGAVAISDVTGVYLLAEGAAPRRVSEQSATIVGLARMTADLDLILAVHDGLLFLPTGVAAPPLLVRAFLQVAVGDVNADGFDDLIDARATIALGRAVGGVAIIPGGGQACLAGAPSKIVVTDLDRDGRADLAAACPVTPHVYWQRSVP